MNKHRTRLYRARCRQEIDRPLTPRERAKVFRMGRRRELRKQVNPNGLYIVVPVLDQHSLFAEFTEDHDYRLEA